MHVTGCVARCSGLCEGLQLSILWYLLSLQAISNETALLNTAYSLFNQTLAVQNQTVCA